jgi:hypothetical protein
MVGVYPLRALILAALLRIFGRQQQQTYCQESSIVYLLGWAILVVLLACMVVTAICSLCW